MQYWNLFAYLAGYGIGTVLGMAIENLISIGFVIVRLITPGDPQILMSRLSTLGYGMTRIEGTGSFSGTVSIIFMIVPRKELSRLLSSSPGNTRIFSIPSRTSGTSRTGRGSSIRTPNAVSSVSLVCKYPVSVSASERLSSAAPILMVGRRIQK